MWRCTLVCVVFGLVLASSAASQAVEGTQVVASLAEGVPEPPDWMVWLCGIAVAAVIALRRIRGRGLGE